jgi:hypothetical protein
MQKITYLYVANPTKPNAKKWVEIAQIIGNLEKSDAKSFLKKAFLSKDPDCYSFIYVMTGGGVHHLYDFKLSISS